MRNKLADQLNCVRFNCLDII